MTLLLTDYYYPKFIAEDSGLQRAYVIRVGPPCWLLTESRLMNVCLTQTQMPTEVREVIT